MNSSALYKEILRTQILVAITGVTNLSFDDQKTLLAEIVDDCVRRLEAIRVLEVER